MKWRDRPPDSGPGAGDLSANWQRYENDSTALVRFIHDRLLISRENGYALEKRGKLRLEAIVVRELPDLFSKNDIEIATATLDGKV